MIREPFAIGNSLIHSLDPRLKVIIATAYSFVVALSTQFTTLLAALALSILLIGLARLNAREVAKRVAVVNGLVVFFWVVLPLTFPGEMLFHVGPLAVTRSGVLLAAQITLKSNAILLAFMIGGAVLVETVFSWGGLGQYSVRSILSFDYPAIQGVVLVITMFSLLVYLALDIIHALLDPRVILH